MNVHKLNFDTAGNVENITFVLAYKSGEKIGNITNVTDIVTKHPLNSYSEFSFIVHKKSDNNTTPLWDKLTDFKLAWIPEWDMWFEITVELNEDDETIKNVSGITIGEAELSQIMLYNIEINTETDIARDEYVKPTIFYNPSDKSSSLVDRLMEKAPHFKFVHIDSSLMNIQRTYTFDGKSIYDALKEIEKEMNCMFVFHSGSNEDGSIQRGISVFDLEANCLACGHRNTFVDKCPSCGSTNIKHGFGEYTNVFISKENLATEITYSTDTDSVKNCFKLEAGDDLMTAAVRSCNPNGTDYIYYFPDKIQQDMSPELRAKLASYDKLYDEYNQTHKFTIDSTFVDKYNTLVNKYKSYEDTLTPITLPIVGYPKLTKIYFDTIDMAMFLRHRLMPNITKPANTAKGQGDYLVANLPHLAATTSLKSLSVTTADNIIITLANSIVKGAFKITIVNSSLSNNIWRGNFKINSYADETDTYTTPVITITITESYEEYIKQRLDKLLNSEDKNYYDISGLFKQNLDVFRSELHKYCLTSLSTFQKCCQSCIDIMVQQGVSSTAQNNQIFDGTDLYNKLYTPYYQKLNAIQNEIIIREGEIEIIEGYRNNQNELVRSGLQVEIEKIINTVHNTLNFEKYIGKKLHGEFSSFVRMDKYSNYNYISDGLNNTELLKNALDFMVTAQKELFKSATLQHSISGNLKNLLLMREFKPIVNSFKNGNWILVEVDGTVYQLRIIEYTIDFSNNKTIDVRFSDVVSTADGLSDLENILSNAANMTKSYAGISKQSEINTNFRKDMSEMIIKGLDMTNTKIVSNADNQDITWDEHGLLCREYNDILSDYNPCQLKIINHGVYLTTDKWKTAKAGIGRFLYFDPKDNKYKEGYGVIADTLVGNLILSSEVGIYNEEKSIEMDKNGIVVTTNTYNKNVFTIQKELKDPDGNISYQRQLYIDDNGNIVLGGGASISWDNVTGTDHIVTDVDAEKLKNDITAIFGKKLDILEQQIDGKADTWYQPNDPSVDWSTPELKNNHICDLWYKTDTDETFMYNGNGWDAVTGEVPQELWDRVDGKAQIFITTTPPTPPYHKGDLWFAGANADIKTCITARESGSYVESDWKKYNKYTDDTIANNIKNDLTNLEAILGFDGTRLTGTYIYSPNVIGGHLIIGNKNGNYAEITADGKLTAIGGTFKGTIDATDGIFRGTVYANSGSFKGDILANTMVAKNAYYIYTNDFTEGIPIYKNMIIKGEGIGGNIFNSVSFGLNLEEDYDGSIKKPYINFNSSNNIFSEISFQASILNMNASANIFGGLEVYCEGNNAEFYAHKFSENNAIPSKCMRWGNNTSFPFDHQGYGHTHTIIANSGGTKAIAIGDGANSPVIGDEQWCILPYNITATKDSYSGQSEIATIGRDKSGTMNIGYNGYRFNCLYVKSINLNGDERSAWPSGGSSGTSNYNNLTNKPSINGNVLTGNKASADLGLASKSHSHSNYLTSSSLTNYATKDYVHTYVANNSGGGGGSNTLTYGSYSVELVEETDSSSTYRTLRPSAGVMYLGDTYVPWQKLNCRKNPTIISDKRLKNNIIPLSNNVQIEKFYMEMNPVSYYLNNDDENDRHFGFIAQDINKSLNNNGISSDKLGLITFHKFSKPNSDGLMEQYTMSYGEIVPLNTLMTQKAHHRIDAQEQKIQQLQSIILQLQGEISILKQKLGGN